MEDHQGFGFVDGVEVEVFEWFQVGLSPFSKHYLNSFILSILNGVGNSSKGEGGFVIFCSKGAESD